MIRVSTVLFMSLFFTFFGAKITVTGMNAISNPIPYMELAPYLLIPSGILFLITGMYIPRVFFRK